MEASQWLALSVFASYFGLILALFHIIFTRSISLKSVKGGNGRIFLLLGVISFAHTWFYMLSFMRRSFLEYETSASVRGGPFLTRIADWLVNTGLFEQAWSAVCFGPLNWWWSEQLCLFTVGAWTVFLAIEGRRHSIRHLWAYMLLGQVVAISVASNLFYLAVSVTKPTKASIDVSPFLWLSVLLSMTTVSLSPYTSERTFLPNLLCMHLFLVLPLLPWKHSTRLGLVRPKKLYRIVGVLAFCMHMRTTIAGFLSLPAEKQSGMGYLMSALDVLHSHPAQSSIGWDVIWTTVSFLVWSGASAGASQPVPALSAVVATLLGSVGATAPYLLQNTVDHDKSI